MLRKKCFEWFSYKSSVYDLDNLDQDKLKTLISSKETRTPFIKYCKHFKNYIPEHNTTHQSIQYLQTKFNYMFSPSIKFIYVTQMFNKR